MSIEDDAPSIDPDASATALTAARDAVAAYCRPTLSKAEWFASLSPLLTDRGATAYQTVDPAVIPCSAVSGDPTVRDGDDAYTFRINVPTDAGIYETYVTRERTTDPWRVERMAPPE